MYKYILGVLLSITLNAQAIDNNISANNTIDNNITSKEVQTKDSVTQTDTKDPVLKYILLSVDEQERLDNNKSSSTKQENINRVVTFDAKSYLALKEIILPLPQDYARAYLKLKSLANPIKKTVYVKIYKSKQRMYVYVDNKYFGSWKVSTARRGYWTPTGVYKPYSLERMHYSRKYHNSPMPWSVFFKGGYAIHGTRSIHRLGRPASHGCVRVHPRNAKKLYKLIRRYGMHNTKIIIKG